MAATAEQDQQQQQRQQPQREPEPKPGKPASKRTYIVYRQENASTIVPIGAQEAFDRDDACWAQVEGDPKLKAESEAAGREEGPVPQLAALTKDSLRFEGYALEPVVETRRRKV